MRRHEAQWRRILQVLILAAFVLRIALIFRPDALFFTRPFIEDAYYSFSVARSLGHGAGFTIDGAHPTNGVQPLIVLFYAPFFHFFSDGTALRICYILLLLIEAGLAAALWRFIRIQARPGDGGESRSGASLLGLFLFYWSYSTSVYTLNGLETGLAPLFVLITYFLYRRWFAAGGQEGMAFRSAVVGLVAGIAVLARIDTAFFTLALCGYHLLGRKEAAFGRRVRESMAMGTAALFVSAPWWIYNMMRFGHFVPSSGRSQSIVVPLGENLASFVQLILNTLFLVGYLPYTVGLTRIHLLLLAGVLCLLLILAGSRPLRTSVIRFAGHLEKQWRMADAGLWGSYLFLLLAYYLFAFGAPHFLQRYLFILHLFALSAAAVVLEELRRAAVARFRAADVVVVPLLVLVVALALVPYRWNYRQSKAIENDFYQVALWIKTHVPEAEKVGMGQSGTAGFFNRNVVNLDGKVNQEVLLAQRAGRYCDYMQKGEFDYLIDWEKFFTDFRRCTVSTEYAKIDSVGRFFVYRRVGSEERGNN